MTRSMSPSAWTDESGWTIRAGRTADGEPTFTVESPSGFRVRGLRSPEAARRVARRLARGFGDPNAPAPASSNPLPFTVTRFDGDAA